MEHEEKFKEFEERTIIYKNKKSDREKKEEREGEQIGYKRALNRKRTK